MGRGVSARQVCQRCGEEVRWARTVNGKRIMLDFSPDPDGNNFYSGRGQVRQLGGRELEKERAAGTPLFRPHRLDCAAERPPVSGRMPPHVRAQLQQRSHGSPARRARG